MRLYKDTEKRFAPPGRFQIDPPPPRNAKHVMNRPGTIPRRPIKRQSMCSELPVQADGFVVDSPMISACYEAHLSMEKMLAIFAELRGDLA